ncbi:MAG TPA: nuclear transport factor 2 family protein [Ignavibacteriaceae bacterium]|nr:nuclear transport factor 2 family protein [Ignavibacteriaceae bacterium]
MKIENYKIRNIILLFVVLFLSSCANKENNVVLENIEISKKSFAAFNRHDWEKQAGYFSDTCQYLDPSYGDKHVVKSRAEKIAKYSKMEEMSPDIKDEITSIFGVDDKVVIQFISSGTAKSDQGDYEWSLPICCVFTFKDGLIIKDETYYNRGK